MSYIIMHDAGTAQSSPSHKQAFCYVGENSAVHNIARSADVFMRVCSDKE